MAMEKNKVKFGLNKVHYAKITSYDEEGVPTFAKPVRIPGAVSLSIDAEGEASQAIGFIRPEHPVLIDPVIVMVEAGRPTVLVASDGDIVLVISLDEVDPQVRCGDGDDLEDAAHERQVVFDIYLIGLDGHVPIFRGILRGDDGR